MAEIVMSKHVFFIGAWRTQNVTDNLHQLIFKKMHSKNGYSTDLNLTADGLYLNIHNMSGQTTKTDRIPLEIIADYIVNNYDNTCNLAIVKDKNHYTVFVFLCRCEADSADMVQEFQKMKKRLSGEGYNLDMKQTGVNWTLKNKETGEGIRHANGDVKVYTTTTTKPNGVGDSVSNTSVSSDVREELNDLAKEVRDIRLMMQKSQGRHHFAKHYGYLNSPPPTQTTASHQTFTTEEVFLKPEQVSDLNVVKRHYIKREPQSNVIMVRGQGGQYKQRQTTAGHYLSSSSQSSLAGSVRRRVYPSPAPTVDIRYASSQRNGQPLRLINTYQHQPYVRREVRMGSSDIVPKSIEHVYKSKKYKRIIPVSPVPPVQHKVYDYVQTQQQQTQAAVEEDVAPVRSVFIDDAAPKVIKMAPAHIRYEGNETHLYENTALTQEKRDLSNVSTLVNVSSNDIIDESERVDINKTQVYRESPQPEQQVIVVKSDGNQVRSAYDDKVTTVHRGGVHSGGVVVLPADREGVTTTTTTVQEDGNVIYIKSDHNVVHEEPQQVFGGEVYHVRAKGLENFDNSYYQAPDEDSNVVIVGRDEYQQLEEPTATNVTVIRSDAAVQPSTSGVTVINHTETNEGIWGEYAKEPEPYDPNVEVVEETAYRYSHSETIINDFDGIKQEINEEIGTPEVTSPKKVGFLDEVEQTIEDQGNEKIDFFENKVDDFEDKVDDFENKVDDFEGKVDNMEQKFDGLEQKVDDLEQKVDDVEQKVGDFVGDDNDNEVRNIIDKVIGDDENNNADRLRFGGDDDTDGNAFRLSKGSVVSELRERFNKESETTVLF